MLFRDLQDGALFMTTHIINKNETNSLWRKCRCDADYGIAGIYIGNAKLLAGDSIGIGIGNGIWFWPTDEVEVIA